MSALSDYRFPPDWLEWKPVAVSGTRALAGVYVDVRRLQSVLDDHDPQWSSHITLDDHRAVCALTVNGVTRCDVGEGDTVFDAANQAFRRACAAFGLGRYLWTDTQQQWADYDSSRKAFTPTALAALRRTLLGDGAAPDVAQLRRQFDDLGQQLYGDQWPTVCARNVKRVSSGATELIGDLSAAQLEKLINGLQKLAAQRKLAA